MANIMSRCFSTVAIAIVRALGPTWQHFMTDDASQIIAFPIDQTVHLRFVKAGAAALALAVEIVDEHSHPIALPPDPAIWLLPFDLASVTPAAKSGLA